jgi:DNA polymerase I-like protein with 3'-5' exonuclease and polymerase domains
MNIIPASEIDFSSLPELEVVWDTENNRLLNETSIDYTSVPYKLRKDFKVHCWVAIDLNSEDVYTFVQDEIKEYFPRFARKVKRWVGHNSINYDHLVSKLYLGMDYRIGPDSVDGKECIIDDTLVLSKNLNPDRPSHSLEYAGQVLGFPKMDWRGEAIKLGLIKPHDPKGTEFETYHPRMIDYCIQDCQVTKKWLAYLMQEWGDWNWNDAYQLEKAVAEIITRQEHRGFYFDSELARKNLEELDKLMEDIRVKVEPTLPPKKATKTLQKEFTPPATQFLKSGQPSSYIKKFAERVGAEISGSLEEGFKLIYESGEHNLPFDYPLVSESPMTLADSTQIKEYLVQEFNWQPTSYKERDLTVDQKKKKVNKDKFKQVVERYVEQTLESAFCKDRCDHLKVKPDQLMDKLLSHDLKKPLKVLTNPSFTVGQEKELCPGLERIANDYPHAQDIAHWLTYRHRRNSILGGGAEWEDDAEKGFLSFVREDGRIPTPADTCGAGTSRFKHKITANIPRITSLFGENMRGMFGVDTKECYQLGYDFDSLEAKITGHYIWKYPGGPELAHALIAEKPNDVHSLNAKKLGISRNDSKTFFYAALYGAQPAKLAKGLGWPLSKAKKVFNGFWQECKPIALLKDNLTKYWETVGKKQFILGIDGRKVPTRSAHALLNSLFQNGGVISAKRAMVLHDRMLRQEGLIIDFFK